MTDFQDPIPPTALPEAPTPPKIPFEELTLWEVLRLLVYRPGATLRRYFDAIALDAPTPVAPTFDPSAMDLPTPSGQPEQPAVESSKMATSDQVPETATAEIASSEVISEGQEATQPIFVYRRLMGGLLLAIFLAFIGGRQLWSAALVQRGTVNEGLKGAPFWFALAAFAYIGVVLYQSRPWWQARLADWRRGKAS